METILHLVLVSLHCACFEKVEASVNVGVSNNTVSASIMHTQTTVNLDNRICNFYTVLN